MLQTIKAEKADKKMRSLFGFHASFLSDGP